MIGFAVAICALAAGIGVADWKRPTWLKLALIVLWLAGMVLLFAGLAGRNAICRSPASEMLAVAPSVALWFAVVGLSLIAFCAGFFARAMVSNVYGGAGLGVALLLITAAPPTFGVSMTDCLPSQFSHSRHAERDLESRATAPSLALDSRSASGRLE